MDEFFQYLVLKNSNTKKIKILFVWENNIKRPLWSYETEEDPEIINLSNFNELRNNKENNLSYDFEGYFISNWDKYNVWTEQCKKFLNERLKNNPKINVVGPIFSYDLGLKLELPKTKIISIFGYETHKWSCGISTIAEYQNKDLFLIQKFYSDVLDAIEGNDVLLAIKRKKEFSQTLEKKYIKNIFEKLKMHPQVIYVNPKISPYRLIQNTDCTISMPFTSTSVAAKFMNKNSIYYDPINQINVDDPSRCDVEVIKDKIKLTQWINTQFKINNN
jgi:polysaccharide biosynthesis PFTS motif protein